MTDRQPRRAEPIDKVTLRNGAVRYRFRIDLGVKADGSRDRRFYTYRSYKEARAEYRRISTEVAAGTHVNRGRLTVAEHLEDWLAGKRDIRPNTLRNYRDAAKPILRDLGQLALQQLTKAHIDRFLTSLRRRDGKAYAPETIRLTLSVLKQVTKDAKRQGLIARDPAEFVQAPIPAHGQRTAVWTRQEANQFRKHVRGDRLYALWLLTLCGLRRSEVLGLRWVDINFQSETIVVRQARVEVTASFIDVQPPKTTRGLRTLPITGEVAGALRTLHTIQNSEHIEFGGGSLDDSALIATEPDGRPILPRTYTDRFTRAAKNAGVPVITLRNVRHTSVSVMLDAGVPPTTVAAWHGHDPRMTVTVYGRTYDDSLRSAGRSMFQSAAESDGSALG
jgi:integrase